MQPPLLLFVALVEVVLPASAAERRRLAVERLAAHTECVLATMMLILPMCSLLMTLSL